VNLRDQIEVAVRSQGIAVLHKHSGSAEWLDKYEW
jgi:hypothetical protein